MGDDESEGGRVSEWILGNTAEGAREQFEEYRRIQQATDDEAPAPGESVNKLLENAFQSPGEPDTWTSNFDEVVQDGVYSPIQLALVALDDQGFGKLREFPFCFSLIGNLLSRISKAIAPDDVGEEKCILSPTEWAETLQTIFYLRETTEEGEHPSVEMVTPSRSDLGETPDLPLEWAGRVFGRGVAMVHPTETSSIREMDVSIDHLFDDATTTPSSLLYDLERPFRHLSPDEISISLRRDRHVTIATERNPILEFYDGGWNVVDIESGRAAMGSLFESRFDDPVALEPAQEKILHLGYHMATHWHSGIIAVLTNDSLEDALEEEETGEDILSKKIPKVVKKDEEGTIDNFHKLADGEGDAADRGRVLLTNAIQDGALIIRSDGHYDSAGRMAQLKQTDRTEGGAGTRAANSLAKYGVAMKISEDGSIKLFSRSGDDPEEHLVPHTGLKLH